MAYLSDELLDTEVASPDGTMGQALVRRRKHWNRRLRKNVWPSWKMSWSRTSIHQL